MARRLLARMVVALGLLAAVTSAVATPAVAGSSSPSLFESTAAGLAFSPNGDGDHDLGKVSFVLKRAATVSVRVTTIHPANLIVSLGRLPAGRHTWRWDGRDGDGNALPDRSYLIRLRADNGSGTSKAFVNIDIRTSNPGTLAATRPVVYPAATAVTDHVQLTFVTADWDPYNEDYWGVPQARSRLRIVSRSGDVVWKAVVSDTYTPRFDWDARSPGGGPLPAGRYDAKLKTTDAAGNTWTHSRPITVSHQQLVAEVFSTTMPAGIVATYDPYYDGCNGCGDVCSPLSSDRFENGLSFRPCVEPWPYATQRSFTTDVPFAAAPVDRYRISVTGGPTVPGGTDAGRLVVGELAVTDVTGEGVTTSGWLKVDLNHQPSLPTLHQPVVWSFSTGDPSSYDVASFTLDYLHYVPAA